MTFTPGSKLNEDDLTQEDIDEYNKRRQKEYDDANNPKDPNDLEEELKKRKGREVKYTKPIPLEELPETPAVFGEMRQEFEETKRNVEREIEVEGLGKGRLVISRQNDNKPFFYADEANVDANVKAAKQLSVAENIVNLPVTVAPFVGIARGAKQIFNQNIMNRYKKLFMKVEESIGKDNTIVTPEQPIIENVPQYPTVIQRILKVKKDNPQAFTGIENSIRKIGDLSSNEKIKQSLLKDEQIELPATYKGGPKTFREKADFFDVSAAIIGGGKEDMVNPDTDKYFKYDRLATTEFGKKAKSKNRDIIFNHIRDNIGEENISRAEFDRYANEQVAGEGDLRDAIRILNLKAYATNRYIDMTPYDTPEKQLKFLSEINKAKRPPRRRKDKETGEFTEDAESFEARTEIWKLETAPFQQYTDYKETFDYGHIISAKTGFRTEDVGMNRISNTEIEAAHNVVSRDPITQKQIEILQEGNRERGARRDYLPRIQMMRNTSATVIEDFVKWQSRQPWNVGPNLTAILDKFIPREQHDNYLKYVKKRFEEKRSLSGSLKQFLENEIGIPYKDYVKFPNRLKLKAKDLYEKDKKEMGNVIGKQQYDQGAEWMQEAADAFIQLHHFDKNKRLRTTKEDTQIKDIQNDEDGLKNIQDLIDELNKK